MRHILLSLIAIIAPLVASAQYRPDILGDGFEQLTIDIKESAPATLVRALPHTASTRAILYIHGYNDYFFQREMATQLLGSGYNFYAIDLHNYGRSLRPSQIPYELYSIDEYFPEITAAVEIILSEGIGEVYLMGHSTGGLIAALYCNALPHPNIKALILNSPFLDMNLGEGLFENIAVPIAAQIGAILPSLELSQDSSTAYFESLHIDHKGEWEFDPALKLKISPPITAAWIRAIHLAHKEIQTSSNIEIPILLLYSDKSTTEPLWSPSHQCSDSVLDVDDIAKYGALLGGDVSHQIIKDGMHDILLSNPQARHTAYAAIFEWLRDK